MNEGADAQACKIQGRGEETTHYYNTSMSVLRQMQHLRMRACVFVCVCVRDADCART